MTQELKDYFGLNNIDEVTDIAFLTNGVKKSSATSGNRDSSYLTSNLREYAGSRLPYYTFDHVYFPYLAFSGVVYSLDAKKVHMCIATTDNWQKEYKMYITKELHDYILSKQSYDNNLLKNLKFGVAKRIYDYFGPIRGKNPKSKSYHEDIYDLEIVDDIFDALGNNFVLPTIEFKSLEETKKFNEMCKASLLGKELIVTIKSDAQIVESTEEELAIMDRLVNARDPEPEVEDTPEEESEEGEADWIEDSDDEEDGIFYDEDGNEISEELYRELYPEPAF